MKYIWFMKKISSQSALLRHVAITQKVLRKADARLSLHGISFTEYLVLHHLAKANQQTMRRIDLADAVGLSASGVTRLIAPMVKNHWVEKRANPRDARVSSVQLSDPGKTLFNDAAQTLSYLAEEIFTNFKQTDLNSLAGLESMMVS